MEDIKDTKSVQSAEKEPSGLRNTLLRLVYDWEKSSKESLTEVREDRHHMWEKSKGPHIGFEGRVKSKIDATAFSFLSFFAEVPLKVNTIIADGLKKVLSTRE